MASPKENSPRTILFDLPYSMISITDREKRLCFLYYNNDLNEKACTQVHKPNFEDDQTNDVNNKQHMQFRYYKEQSHPALQSSADVS